MLSGIWQNIKNYFYFSKSQQVGLIVLCCLLILSLLAYYLLPKFIKNDLTCDPTFILQVEQFRASQVPEDENRVLTPFPFDPNTIAADKMAELGLSKHQAEMIEKYRIAGGKFRNKEDFSKIYSITNEDYQTLEPFLLIPVEPPKIISRQEPKHKITPFAFNPNQCDSSGLLELGLENYQVENIINYRKSGGSFRVKSDFKKLYNIDDATYLQLEKYILLPSKDSVSQHNDIVSKPLAVIIEINSADTTELQKLRGIGPVYAHRIVKYREKLGGFYDKSQLLEIFGLDTTRFSMFVNQIEVDQSCIKKLDLNTTKFGDMVAHPYFEYYMVKSIFNYKDAVGSFDSINQLKQINLIYDHLFTKIEPYLTINGK